MVLYGHFYFVYKLIFYAICSICFNGFSIFANVALRENSFIRISEVGTPYNAILRFVTALLFIFITFPFNTNLIQY